MSMHGWVRQNTQVSCVCARSHACAWSHVCTRPHACACQCARWGRGTSAGPVLTLLTLCTFVASLTQAEATDGITAPMAHTAVARVDAIRPPVPVVTGCNRAQSHLVASSTARSEHGASWDRMQGRDQWTKDTQKDPHNTSLAAEARPPRGTAAASSGRVAVSVVGASTPHLAAGSKPACWAGCWW